MYPYYCFEQRQDDYPTIQMNMNIPTHLITPPGFNMPVIARGHEEDDMRSNKSNSSSIQSIPLTYLGDKKSIKKINITDILEMFNKNNYTKEDTPEEYYKLKNHIKKNFKFHKTAYNKIIKLQKHVGYRMGPYPPEYYEFWTTTIPEREQRQRSAWYYRNIESVIFRLEREVINSCGEI